MLNERQTEIGEKVLVNSANVILASLIFGNLLSPKGFNLSLFLGGGILFTITVGLALWMRKGDS